jgi:DNA-binding SARP family transcriptional activator
MEERGGVDNSAIQRLGRPLGAPGFGVSSTPPVVAAKITVPEVTALSRDRLERVFERMLRHRLGVVTAPAGSGKTTLLAQLAARTKFPVAWYRADPSDGSAAAVLAYLEAALTRALADLVGGWTDAAHAANALESWHGERALLIVDDLHALQGTPGEACLEQFIEYAPPTLSIVVASRHPSTINLSRLRVAGQVVDVVADDLRFRSWEVERLFHGFYREPLRPEDLAALARRTEGWAAGLQLFHLATRGRRPEEQRRVLQELAGQWGLVREYLSDNVLKGLDADVRRFLVETSVLGRLSGSICDEYLEASGSDAVLAQLERQHIFTVATGHGWYRYHEVFRSHLQAVLAEQVGEAAMAQRHRRAGRLLEAADALDDALAAYSRGQDAAAVARLLGHEGEQLAAGQAQWLEYLPPAISAHDPWVLLAAARRHRDAGRWTVALETYRAAERAFANTAGAAVSRSERALLKAWEEPALHRRDDWMGHIRAAVVREPLGVSGAAARVGTPQGALAAGLAALLGGAIHDARRQFTIVIDDPGSSDATSMVAHLGSGVARLLAGDPSAVIDLEWLLSEAERMGWGWLARIGRAALALSDRADGVTQAAAVAQECRRDGDRWGAAVASLLSALGSLGSVEAVASAEAAADDFAQLGAGTLHAWSVAAAALAGSGGDHPPGIYTPADAAAVAHATGVRGAEMLALLSMARAEPARTAELAQRAAALAADCGLQVPVVVATASTPPPPESVRIRMLGGLQIQIDGREVDLQALKPRVRSLLRLLALHAGRPLHREVIIEALWPEAEADTAKRILHVALTALRHALEPDAGRNGATLLARDGEAYRLALPPGAQVDVRLFEASLAEGRNRRAAGDSKGATAAFEQALWLHTDDLLPEEGPAEWVVAERERLRTGAADAAQSLVELYAARGDPTSAAVACVRGLHLDRYRDALWRMLIGVHEGAGDVAAASHTRQQYHELLAELGLPAPGQH